MKKKTLEEEIKAGVLNEVEYKAYSESIITKVLESIQSSSGIFINTIEKIIKQKNFNPLQKFFALKLLEAALENDQSLELAGYIGASALLEHLRNMAAFRKEDSSESRGATLFGSESQQMQMHSVNFFLLLLEFFEYWGSILPEDNENTAIFYKYYTKLVEAGVTFPQKFKFIAVSKQSTDIKPNTEIKDSRAQISAPLDSHEKSLNSKTESVTKKSDPAAVQVSQASSERSLDHKAQPHHVSLVKAHYRHQPASNPKEKALINNSQPEKRKDNKPTQDQQKGDTLTQNVSPQKTGPSVTKVPLQEEYAQFQIAPTNKNLGPNEKPNRTSVEENKVQRGRNDENRKDNAYLDEDDDFDFQDAEEIAEDNYEDSNSQNLKIEQEPRPHYKSRELQERAIKNKNEARRPKMQAQMGRAGLEQKEENFEEHSVAQIQRIPTTEYEQVSHNPLRLESNIISEENKEKLEPRNSAFAVHHESNQRNVIDPAYYNTSSRLSEGTNLGRGQNEMRNRGEVPVQLNFERGLEEIRRTVYANAEKAGHVLKIDESIEKTKKPLPTPVKESPNKSENLLKENDELKKKIQQFESAILSTEKRLSQSKSLEIENQELHNENTLLLAKLEKFESEKKYTENTGKNDNKKMEELIKKNGELQQRVKNAEMRLVERSQEVEDLQLQLSEKDALIQEMHQTILALEDERKEIIQQFNAISNADVHPITEPEDYPHQLDDHGHKGRANDDIVEVVLDRDFLQGISTNREHHTKKSEHPNTIDSYRRSGDEGYTNPRELFFSVNLDAEEPTEHSRPYHTSNITKTELESKKSVGVLLRKNLNVDLAELTGSRIGFLEYDYGSNQPKPASSYSSRKASHDIRESPSLSQKEEFVARSEERELIIGRLVETEEFIKAFEEYLQSIDEEDSRKQLKAQGLAKTFLLHEDKYILITVESSFQYDTHSKKNRVALRIRFKNKTSSVLQNFQIEFASADGIKIITEQGRQLREIQPLLDEIRTIYAYYEGIPQGLPMMSWSFSKNDEIREQLALLPLFMHRFLEFKKIDRTAFRSKWTQWKRLYPSSTFKTEDIALNSMIIAQSHDFRKISDRLVEIPFKNGWKKAKYIKFGGIFNIEFLGVEYILRIFVDRGLTNAVIQIICYPSKEAIGIAVINQLAFLLQNT